VLLQALLAELLGVLEQPPEAAPQPGASEEER
jgi:hypothetical protein